MPNNQNKEYFNGKIVSVNSPDKFLECFSKLHPASLANYAHIHADGEESNSFGSKKSSKLGIKIQEGSGDNLKSVRVNISPEEAEFVFYGLIMRDHSVSLDNLKIFGEPDEKGRCKANALKLGYDSRPDKQGKPRRSPWLIRMSQGTGIKKQNKNGGFFCENGSYKAEKEAYMYLSDYEMFRFFLRIKKFIDAWERFVSDSLFYDGIKAQEDAFQEWFENWTKTA